MMAAPLETRASEMPAGITASNEGEGLVVRWEGRKLDLQPDVTFGEIEALLEFCYDAGFADASNPRLFAP